MNSSKTFRLGEAPCCGRCTHYHGKGHQGLNKREEAFLLCLGQIPFLPVCSFAMGSSYNEQMEQIAFAPVYLLDRHETFERLVETGTLLKGLARKGFITLDYQIPLQGCDYEDYLQAISYKSFRAAILTGGEKGFLYDIPKLQCGSMALTAAGAALIEETESA